MGAAADKLMEDARAVFKPIPLNPPKLENNEATPEKLALGTMLYFDQRLSASHAISCASCHAIGLGGADNESIDRLPLAALRAKRADGVQRGL
jgi:cytochrome c peroxidase